MTILKVKTKNSWAGPGMDAYDAEAKIWNDDGKTLYVHCTLFEGECFSVSEKSVMPFMADIEPDKDDECFEDFEDFRFLENYISLSDAFQSDYIDVFIYLKNVLEGMMDITYGHSESVYKYVVSELEEDSERNFNSLDDFDINSSYSFEYRSKIMPKTESRRLVAGVSQDGAYFRLYGVDDIIIEDFDDISQASRSKWAILYEKARRDVETMLRGELYLYAQANRVSDEDRKRIVRFLGD